MEKSASIVIRKMLPFDKDFILNSWLKSQLYGSPYWSQVDKNIFYKNYSEKIIKLLSISEVEVVVLSDAQDVVLGYCVHKEAVIHWAYVKKDYRNQGILNMLLKNKNFRSTSSTTLAGAAIRKKKNIEFNPF